MSYDGPPTSSQHTGGHVRGSGPEQVAKGHLQGPQHAGRRWDGEGGRRALGGPAGQGQIQSCQDSAPGEQSFGQHDEAN